MADKIEGLEESLNEGEGEQVESIQPETIKLGDQEYSPDELSELVELGKMGREAEEKYNTKLSGVWPEYTKKSQQLKDLQNEIEELKKSTTQTQPNTNTQNNTGQLSELEKQQAVQALKELGVLTKDEIESMGVVTKDKFADYYHSQSQVQQTINRMGELAKEYDGKDGRPAFQLDKMAEFMNQQGIADPEIAYKIKYESELDSWREKKLNDGKKAGLVTETKSTPGTKQPEPKKITRDNLSAALKEALHE